MKLNSDPSPQQLANLAELSLALGLSKKKSLDQLAPIKLAFHPYVTSKSVYTQLQTISQAWQKLIFKASRDCQFIDKVYASIKENDAMISQMMRIQGLKTGSNDDGVLLFRTDYFINQDGEPKIIEYNLTSVSMTAHSQHFQQAKRLSDPKNGHKYVNNQPNKRFTSEIHELYTRKQLKGIFLMIVSPNQSNIMEQRQLQIQLLKVGIKVIRLTLFDVVKRLILDADGNLKLNDEYICIVYYRAGYQLSDYQQDPINAWKARQIIEVSNAIKIPNVTFDLMNQKRMQVQLSKESVYSQYLSPEESSLIRKSLVPVWEFDHMSESEFAQLLNEICENGKDYVLKPNLEGGGHNIYGQDVKTCLAKMDAKQRRKYILMEKIITKPIQNILLNGSHHVKTKCIYEASQYGILAIESNKLLKSDSCGFLIRVKPEDKNEGGIMAGVGSLCSWMIEDSE